jgi:hypothetical protein
MKDDASRFSSSTENATPNSCIPYEAEKIFQNGDQHILVDFYLAWERADFLSARMSFPIFHRNLSIFFRE